jgi:hypothetical protein
MRAHCATLPLKCRVHTQPCSCEIPFSHPTPRRQIANRLLLQGPVVEQPEYHLLHRTRMEEEYLPLFEQHGLGTTMYAPS